MKLFQRKSRTTKPKLPIKENFPPPLKDDSEFKTIEIEKAESLTTAELFALNEGGSRENVSDRSEEVRRSDHMKSEAEDMSIPEQYQFALDLVTTARFEKAEVLENKIENMIEKQITQLRQMQNNRPNFLPLSQKKKLWNKNLTRHKTTIARLRERLRVVHEVKEKVTHEGPTIEIFARKKLQFKDPSLVSKYVKYLEEERKKQRKKKIVNTHARTAKRGLRLKLT